MPAYLPMKVGMRRARKRKSMRRVGSAIYSFFDWVALDLETTWPLLLL
jgi:hypothetical protein